MHSIAASIRRTHHRQLLFPGHLARLLLLAGGLRAAAGGAGVMAEAGCSDCPETTVYLWREGLPPFLTAEAAHLTCYPALLTGDEGRWSFFLRGSGALDVEGARLEVEGATYAALRLDYPAPTSVLVDLEFPPLTPMASAVLIVTGPAGELARFPILVTPPTEVPREQRQSGIVRLQLAPGALAYPLHGLPGDRPIESRPLEELSGDGEFLGVLEELGIERVRKVIPRYAEDDSVHWDERHNRYHIIGGRQLRSYLVYLDEERSEAAYLEILRGFPQVEEAFVNEDRSGQP